MLQSGLNLLRGIVLRDSQYIKDVYTRAVYFTTGPSIHDVGTQIVNGRLSSQCVCIQLNARGSV